MRFPAAAVGWEFRQRHRWGFGAVLVLLLVLATIKLVVVARGIPIYLDSGESFAFVVMMPLTATFTYFLAVFTFGLDGDLGARASMYPCRIFTLPVTTAQLSGWPMLYGSAAVMLLWLVIRIVGLWPSGINVPWIWPALLAASLLAWTQALTWMPYPLPGLRIIVAVLWLATMDAIALVALHFQARESVMLWIVAPQIPLAYFVAWFAVARARTGEVPDWRGAFTSVARISDLGPSRRANFKSPASAQTWFEWRRYGRSLPAWVAILLPFDLALLWVARDTAILVVEMLVSILLTPPLVAAFAAAAVSSSSASSDSYVVTPFIATRPLTTAELVGAKLKMAARSTALAWLLVFVAVPIGLRLSGTSALVLDRWHRVSAVTGTPRAVVLLLLILAGCIAWTWTQLVRSLYIGLTGRASLVKGRLLLVLGFFFFFGPFAEWIVDSGRLGKVWSAMPLIFAALVAIKMIAVVWIGVRLYQIRLVTDRTLLSGAALWCGAVLILYGVLVWLFDAPHVPHYLLMLIAILAVPLARISATPLALAWNRHR